MTTTPEPYTDPDGDKLTVSPTIRFGATAISLRVERPDVPEAAAGVHIPLRDADLVVAAIRAVAQPTNPAAAVEVRDRCPHCGDPQLVPRVQMAGHLARLHPDHPVWLDGDPLMEAVASAVYEQCRTVDGGIVDDDPRNIAAAAVGAIRAASGVQPDTRPVPTTADKADALGVTPAEYRQHRHQTAVQQIQEAAGGLLAETGLRVMDALEPARAVPDTERRERWAKAIAKAAGSKAFAKTGTEWEHARGAWGLHADAALAVADEEQRDLRLELHEVRTLAARRESKLIGLRAELEKARATTSVEAAHPDKVVFIAEYFEVDRWMYLGTSDDRPSPENLRARTHGMPARLVRATTTYVVEPGGQAEDGAQQPRCPAKHGGLGRICELPAGHDGSHSGDTLNGGAVWDGDAP